MEIDQNKPLEIVIKKSKLESSANILKIIFRSVLILALMLAIGGIMSEQDIFKQKYSTKYVDWNGSVIAKKTDLPDIAIIPIYGMIAGERMAVFDSIPSETILQMLDNAEKDENIKAIILKIDTPGGTVFDSGKIAEKIKLIRENKKIFALLESSATSGGYMIAVNCDKIFAYPETITGSIGVIMEFPNAKDLMDKSGVKMIAITSGNMKTMGSPFENFEDEEKNIFQSIVDETYANFINMVAEERKIPLENMQKLADGRIFSGRQALQHGLIDSIKHTEDLQQELQQNNLTEYNLKSFYLDQSPFDSFTKPLGKLMRSFNINNETSAIMYYK